MIEQAVTRFQEQRLVVRSPLMHLSFDRPVGLNAWETKGYVRFPHLCVTGNLTAREMLCDFLIGLHCPVMDGTRPWLSSFGDLWSAKFGSLFVELDAAQAADACACVDAIGQAYLDAIREARTILEVGSYSEVEVKGEARGVCVLAVTPWMWHLIQRFSQEFLESRGESAWHIFDAGAGRLGIRQRGITVNAAIWPVFSHPRMPDGYVGLVYAYPDTYLKVFERYHDASWKEHVGSDGFWTATQTENWLVDQLLPNILTYYGVSKNLSPLRLLERVAGRLVPTIRQRQHQSQLPLWMSVRGLDRVPFSSLSEVGQLAPYLGDLQQWLNLYPVNTLPMDLLRSYYQAMIDVARHMKVDIAEGDSYLIGNVKGALAGEEIACFPSDPASNDKHKPQVPLYRDVLQCLDVHMERVARSSFESRRQADLLSSAFLWIVRHGQSQCELTHIEAAKEAIAPLWEQCRFEVCYRRAIS